MCAFSSMRKLSSSVGKIGEGTQKQILQDQQPKYTENRNKIK